MNINMDFWLLVALLLIFFVVGMLVGIGMCLSITGRGESLPGAGRRYRY